MSLNTSVMASLQSSSLAIPPCCPHLPYFQSESILNPNLNFFELKRVQFKIVEPSPVTWGIVKVCLSYKCPFVSWKAAVRILVCVVQAAQTKLFHPVFTGRVFHASDQFCGPTMDLSCYGHVFLVLGSTELDIAPQVGSHNTRWERENCLLWLGGPRVQLAFWHASVCCWHTFRILSSSWRKSFSTGLLSVSSSHSLYW